MDAMSISTICSIKNIESTEARRLRTQPWLLNANGEFVSASELTVQTMNPQYDVSSDEALELFHILGIKEEIEDPIDVDITSFGEQLGLSEEEQRQALLEFAKRKKSEEYEDDLNISFDHEESDDIEVGTNSMKMSMMSLESVNHPLSVWVKK